MTDIVSYGKIHHVSWEHSRHFDWTIASSSQTRNVSHKLWLIISNPRPDKVKKKLYVWAFFIFGPFEPLEIKVE